MRSMCGSAHVWDQNHIGYKKQKPAIIYILKNVMYIYKYLGLVIEIKLWKAQEISIIHKLIALIA